MPGPSYYVTLGRLRTVARTLTAVRTIPLIGRRCSKKALRIWPIRSTPIIPPNALPGHQRPKERTLTSNF